VLGRWVEQRVTTVGSDGIDVASRGR